MATAKLFALSANAISIFDSMKNRVCSQLSLPSLNRKATLGSKFSCPGLQQSVARADDIVQAI